MLKLNVRHQTLKGDQINRLVPFQFLSLTRFRFRTFQSFEAEIFFLSHPLISNVNQYKWVPFS